ncbi:DUF11 domain-containing protein [Psychrobacter sp. I-STPA6b]|uniref:DUF11 domain-containing protein n=1 Tax=Psychrobacter sp. I-STPA6b TaxID=2585718 RepID=UPI001D0CB9C1|nr:DUF11 domain-containing protein [Psychrobacter sp. I-STPA6b]
MKKQNFQQSLLAVGVIAALGLSGTAIAAEAKPVTETFDVTNVAKATYQVDGVEQGEVESNPVTVTVSKVIKFELTNNNDKKVTPDGTVTFDHKLTNKGNTDDTYTVKVEDLTSGDDFDYTGTTVKYKKPGMATYEEIPPEGITLKPDETADIQVTTKASDNDINEAGKLKVTAESTLNPAESGKVTNIDTAVTVTPIFAIKKTAEVTQIIAGSTAPFEYRIEIKNTGNMDANGITIEDALPAGLVFADDKELSVQVNGSNADHTDASTGNTLVLTGINIAKESAETLVVKFKVKPVNATDGTTYENIATVKYTPTGDGTEGGGAEIIDTSKHDDDVAGDPNDTNDTPAPKIQVLKPGLTFESPEEITLPPTGANDTNDSVFKHTITNTGTTDQNNLKLTTDVTLDSGNISQTIYVDNGDGIFNPSEDTIYAGTTLPTIKPGKHLDIFVVNTATNANPGTDGVSALREEYTIKVSGSGLATTANLPSVTDKVKIAALELKKEQAVAACEADLSSLTFSKAAITEDVEPGQCIYYQISAINHLPSSNPTQQLKEITNLMISDTLDEVGTGIGKVTFNNDITNTGLTNAATYDSGSKTVSSAGNTLAAEATAKVNFSVTINER